MHHNYTDDGYKDLINIFTNGLGNKDLHLKNFDNWIISKNNVNRYLKEQDVDVFEENFDFEKSI